MYEQATKPETFYHSCLQISFPIPDLLFPCTHDNISQLLLVFQFCEFHSKSFMRIVRKTSWRCVVFMSIVLLVLKSTIRIHHISPLNVGFQIDIPHNLFALYKINFRNDENLQCT